MGTPQDKVQKTVAAQTVAGDAAMRANKILARQNEELDAENDKLRKLLSTANKKIAELEAQVDNDDDAPEAEAVYAGPTHFLVMKTQKISFDGAVTQLREGDVLAINEYGNDGINRLRACGVELQAQTH